MMLTNLRQTMSIQMPHSPTHATSLFLKALRNEWDEHQIREMS